MATIARESPYIWVTWLTGLLVGDKSCEWAAWFKAHHLGYAKVPSDFDLTSWQLRHTDLLNRGRDEFEAAGYSVRTEGQNSFTLRGKTATLGGKPDLIALKGNEGIVCDAKTGSPKASDHAQVLIYLYAIPRVLPEYTNVNLSGLILYENERVEIPGGQVDETFITRLSGLIGRVGDGVEARRVPSASECAYCEITEADCNVRVTAGAAEGVTEDF